MGRPTGTCSSLISIGPSGCWSFHIHCFPTTKISVDASGGREFRINRLVPHRKVTAQMPSGMIVQTTSSGSSLRFVSPWFLPSGAGNDGEIEDGEKDERGEKQIDRGEEVVKMIDAPRDGGGLIRPYGEPLPHARVVTFRRASRAKSESSRVESRKPSTFLRVSASRLA